MVELGNERTLRRVQDLKDNLLDLAMQIPTPARLALDSFILASWKTREIEEVSI